MKKRSKLGANFAACKVACGICATNDFKLPYRLGVALFNLEESPESNNTLDSISKQFKSITTQEIDKLHIKVQEIIKIYKGVKQDVS
jgi:hypothetical protein